MIHRHGGDIYTYGNVSDFSANINYRGMPSSVREAAVRAVDASVHYPDPDCRALRCALAEREKSFYGARNVSEEDLICGNGAAEIMFALTAAFRPKRALLAVPSFFEYEQALAAVGCEICRFRLKPERGFTIGEDFLEAARCFSEKNARLTETDIFAGLERTETAAVSPADTELSAPLDSASGRVRSMVILGSPNNPTGRLIEKEILTKLVDLCRERQILLVLDESFIDFLDEDDRQRTCSGVRFLEEKARRRTSCIFLVRSFTKMYAMPGVRFGYGLCTDRQLLEKMRRLLQPWNVSLIAQEAASAAASEQEFARESAAYVAQNREEMKAALEEAGFEVFPSCVNFLLLRAPANLAEVCLKKGFLIRDCSNFPGLPNSEDGRGYFRVCVRSREENEALVRAMGMTQR
ncbi:MAG: aminotransferase class I/II-fold pyridoxal phosphate-dependent enzyme [Clostridiales bacterium]|nr:aminotransferase class I/II-fold pyridoxal phosphate-dependent enzyme [Clostridiales bacterium]